MRLVPGDLRPARLDGFHFAHALILQG
jgi:hypothetical protein